MQNVMNVSYDTKIPNNVNLSSDRRVLKALEKWHPGYIDWWTRLIPKQFQDANVYLRSRTPTVELVEIVELGPTLRKKRRAKHFQRASRAGQL